MRERNPPFAALRVLESASRLKNYSLAGEELGVTHSAVSQTVRRLESAYEQVLFRRRGSQMEPTAASLALAEAYRQAEHAVVRAGRAVRSATSELNLVIGTSSCFAKLWLGPRLAGLSEALSGVSVGVRMNVDFARLESDGVDVAVHAGWIEGAHLRATLLFDEYAFPVCSPRYFERHQPNEHNLASVPLIGEVADLWPVWFAAKGLQAPRRDRGPVFDDAALTVEAAVAGLGVALVRQLDAQGLLDSGRLVQISTTGVRHPRPYYLVWRDDSPRIALIRRFSDWVLAEVDRSGLLNAA